MIRCVLFDLDGTLADTAADLAWALNQLLIQQGRAELPLQEIRKEVSHGGAALIRLGFHIEPDDDGFEPLRQALLSLYKNNICRQTRLMPGMSELLHYLETQGYRWGIVTNKPSWLTDPLIQAMQLQQRAACVISGDQVAEPKPHPASLLMAAEKCDHPAQHCVYVGDAQRDIQAGRAAGMQTLAATFGYLREEDEAANWQADALVHQPDDIRHWLSR
ncbi:MAG: HAD-IA family hydrolase [gamma proteobacterium symbiont of Bathyaustriella thionipta]|nr:HAD-IA family hydrolase [gamma proteobacterium symbiont of Bathyaustriella thionipta]